MHHMCEKNIREHRPGGIIYCTVCGKQFVVMDDVVVMPSSDPKGFYRHFGEHLRKKIEESK